MDHTQPTTDEGGPNGSNTEQPQIADAESPSAEDASPEIADAADTPSADEKENGLKEMQAKWPGWPGYTVYRIVVPVLKVGSIIGRKGDLIKKLVEETRARVRILEGLLTSPDRIVLISGKEEPEAPLSPAVDAVIRIFKRINGLPENYGDDEALGAAGIAFCSIRLLVASSQGISLIGKQGSLIKSIQESTGASIRILSNDEMPVYANSEERIVELQGEALKVLKALEAVVGHLRKFLVDQSVLPLFEKSYNAPPVTQERQVDTWSDKALRHTTPRTSFGNDYPLQMKRDSLFLDHESQMESHIPSSRFSLYGSDHVPGNRSSAGIGRTGGPIVTQIAQTMQIPLAYAEDIIGVQGANIDYIRRTSGAILTVQESRGLHDEITVEIKGTSSQVQTAQQLIQEFTSGHRETIPETYSNMDSSLRPSYSWLGMDSSLRPSYSQLGSGSYSSSSYREQHYDGYGSSGLGGYRSFRQ
ncbi:RNA-binding KH domain-containing protein PEPPER-like [Olea europaea var. sylvestris]|uniref:RNA-binding KH domain-containing protein PEPPER-like n=1 Tax=Olea europaea var. sylvestris TaxID=158386 RepID=UPI000C1D5ED5|nr:RNA-binding KH domain-containing protein PEPPER-like [Olea europaea var. sylvestris]